VLESEVKPLFWVTHHVKQPGPSREVGALGVQGAGEAPPASRVALGGVRGWLWEKRGGGHPTGGAERRCGVAGEAFIVGFGVEGTELTVTGTAKIAAYVARSCILPSVPVNQFPPPRTICRIARYETFIYLRFEAGERVQGKKALCAGGGGASGE